MKVECKLYAGNVKCQKLKKNLLQSSIEDLSNSHETLGSVFNTPYTGNDGNSMDAGGPEI